MRTKEETIIAKRLACKKWYAKNKEAKKAWNKEWYSNDKERSKKQHKKNTLPFYVMYGLPNEMYCGITNNIYHRMGNHKSLSRDTEGWFIISTYKTRSEALEAELEQHKLGWLGSKNVSYPAQDAFSAIHN